ncbi:TonB-dependent receptor [Porphyromonas sp.]|uniref:TonB-dependent receptor n=1 Tax=Porphyromonas sp. TaxID=1924944 RepID=UPI0026DB30A8|nr:TonB-dependent receptor [Porphyromonas sp.]MDO4770885.1 TonB-dependent receptor [Porphyromonas sp.]
MSLGRDSVNRIAWGLLLTVLFAILSPTTLAQGVATSTALEQPSDSLKIYLLKGIVTYGQKPEVVPAQTLSGKEIERLNVVSVADALRYFSGVQIKDYGGIGGLKTINVRSMGSQHVGVFFDGIQITNAQNGTVDLGKFSLDNMEAISLYNGQRSDLFQSAKDYASASAVYMVTRKPVFKRWQKDNYTFKAKTGSFNLVNASMLWERRLSDKISLSANTEFMYTSGRYKFRYQKFEGYDTTEIRRNGDVTALRAEAALFGKLNGGEWMTKAYFYGSERGYPGAAVKKDYEISLLNEDRQTDRNFFVQSLFRKSVSSLYSVKVQAKYANDYMNYRMPPKSTLQPMDNHYYQQEAYLSIANLFSIAPWWSTNVACDLQYNHLDANGTEVFNANFVRPRRFSILSAVATSIRWKGAHIQGSLLHTFVKDKSALGRPVAADKSILSPTLIASFRPLQGTDLDLRAFYKKIFRMPTFNDLYYVQIGNRLLRPEYATQYNIGLTYKWNATTTSWFRSIGVSADAYYNEVTDKIIATPTSNQLVWTMLNLDYVEIKGLDLGITPTLRLGKVSLNSRLNYTYQIAQDKTPEKDYGGGDDSDHTENFFGHQIPYVPIHSGSLVMGASYGPWDFNYSFIYTGERHMLGGNIPENYIQPWYTSDMSVTRAFELGRLRFKLAAEINNIFNQQYEVVKWYPMPGTNFKINLTISTV